jgi:hypothetical protein
MLQDRSDAFFTRLSCRGAKTAASVSLSPEGSVSKADLYAVVIAVDTEFCEKRRVQSTDRFEGKSESSVRDDLQDKWLDYLAVLAFYHAERTSDRWENQPLE